METKSGCIFWNRDIVHVKGIIHVYNIIHIYGIVPVYGTILLYSYCSHETVGVDPSKGSSW